MKFFTRDWHGGDLPDAEAEQLASRYEAHLAALGARLPNDARRLWEEISLHDGLLRNVERAGNRLEIVFRCGDSRTGYFDARLSYQDVELSGSDEQFLNEAVGRSDVELLYDEFDSADARWVHRFLFWPYHEAAVRFRDFSLLITPAPTP